MLLEQSDLGWHCLSTFHGGIFYNMDNLVLFKGDYSITLGGPKFIKVKFRVVKNWENNSQLVFCLTQNSL